MKPNLPIKITLTKFCPFASQEMLVIAMAMDEGILIHCWIGFNRSVSVWPNAMIN